MKFYECDACGFIGKDNEVQHVVSTLWQADLCAECYEKYCKAKGEIEAEYARSHKALRDTFNFKHTTEILGGINR